MTETFSSIATISLPEITFIGGTYKELPFDVVDDLGSPVDLTSFTFSWVLSPFGKPEITTLAKTGVLDTSVVTNNRFIVYLYSYDTINLSGKYMHQPIITSNPGYEFRDGQGYINIISGLST
jgi:hypothetical protein